MESSHLKRVLVLGVPLILVSSVTLCWTLSSSRASDETTGNPNHNARSEVTLKSGRSGIAEAYGKLPISFEENRGQTDPRVKFVSRGSGSELFLTSTGAVLALRKTSNKSGVQKGESSSVFLRMNMVGANPGTEVVGCDRLPGNSNYLRGADPSSWQSNIPTYGRVQYRDLYPGVNLVYYGDQRQLEYDFEVAPGANPNAIRMSFEGARTIRIDNDGDLVLRRANTEVRMRKPSMYQESDGTRQAINGHYVLRGKRQVGFEAGKYDKTKALVIDPVLTYSTFLGGTSNDSGRSIALDPDGNAYITGQTASFNFPVSINGYSSTYINGYDVFVTKLNADGTNIIYSTYLGGNSDDSAYGIAIDSSRNAYVAGSTSSTNYPTTPGAYQTTLQGGSYYYGDAFVTKLNADGTALVYSTYLGGANADQANGIAIDSSGNAYIAGYTYSSNFPTTAGVFQSDISAGSSQEAFVTELNNTGTALVYSTFLGGTGADQATAIKVDSSGYAYVAGMTTSTNFDITPGAYQTTYGGAPNSYYNSVGDAFASKLNPTGTGLVYSTYIGGTGDDACQGLDLTASGEVYLTGFTDSGNFPTTPGVVRVGNGGIAKTTNAADSWFAQNSGLTNSTELSLAIDPSNPNVVFAGTSGGGVFKSTNGGDTWTAVNSGLTDLTVKALTIDAMTPSTMFLGASTRGIFRSTNSGATWRAINTGQNGTSVNTIKIDPNVSSTIYVGTENGVYKTTNGGATWATSSTGFSQGLGVSALAIDPSATSTIYAGLSYYGSGVYKSTNSGGNWSVTSLNNVQIKSMVLDPAAPATVYIGTDSGVQKSTDGGANWSSASIVLVNKSVNALAISPVDSATLYAGTGNGVFKSTNGGSTWSLSNTGLAGAVINTLAIDPVTPLTIYSGSAAGLTDAFVTKLNAAGTALQYSTYLGGSGIDQGYAVASDASGNAYVTGTTSSQNFPITRGGFDVSGGYGNDAFVTKLNPTGSAFVYSMFLGGSDYDYGYGVAVDPSGSAYVVGVTQSQNFPTTAGVFQPLKSSYNGDAFIAKLDVLPSLSANLAVSMTTLGGPFAAGSYLAYNITVTNNGPERASSILVSDELPSSVVFGSCSSSSYNYCSHAGNSVVFPINSLEAGASVNLQIQTYVACSIPSSVMIANTVTVDSSANDPDLSDNSAMVAISATNPPTTLSPTSQFVLAQGGSNFYLFVNRGTNCGWTSMSNANWITITSSSNCCNGYVNYDIAANPGPPRTGTITVAGQTFTVNQAGKCTYSLDRTSQSFPGNGGNGTINVTSPNLCDWDASTTSSFITITSGTTGKGNGTVQFSVAVNPNSTIRNDTIFVAGQMFTVYQGIDFIDVPSNDPFYTAIGKLSARSVTLGCGGGNYCPNQAVTREQMAAFILRSKGEFNPPFPGTQRFDDVPTSNPFYNFIDRLAVLQITLGCQTNPPLYCPGDAVKREQMAAFILRGLGEFNPPAPSMQRFDDVPPENQFYNFIDRLAVLQITLGCSSSPPLYCPTNDVTRAQMAAFLVRAFDL